jgi:hypothetical protein
LVSTRGVFYFVGIKKVPHPCGSARVGQIQGGFNRIGSIRGLLKPYPFNSITWKYKGVNRYKAK